MPSFIYRISYKIRGFITNIKWFFQRGRKGYCDIDVWNVDIWFCKVMKRILVEFNKNNMGIFNQLYDEYGTEEGIKKQKEIIDKMIYLLDEMNFEKQDDLFKLEECKDEFFELFSKYFYELWW